MWQLLGVVGALTVAAGLVSPGEAVEITVRLLPVLVFLSAITVLAELAEAAYVFDVVAVRAARAARGHTPTLFILVLLLATGITVVLSLDTTAVLFTPVALALAQHLGLPPLPFAFAVIWMANTASLLLPVSNLTNLLAMSSHDMSTREYVSAIAAPALAAVLVTAAVLASWQHRHIRGSYPVPPRFHPPDRVLFWACTGACLLLVPALLLGVPAAWAACICAVFAGGVTAWRRRGLVHSGLLPWRLVIAVEGLFLIVEAAGPLGLDRALAAGVGSPLQTAFVAAAGANAANNLPAYLAMERVVPQDQVLAVLLGVNLGPLVLPWASLATLLWAQRCRARGVNVDWGTFGIAGIILVPLLLLATVPLLP